MQLETEHLTLVLQSTEEILAWVDSLDVATRAEISPGWLERIHTSTAPDPWTHGFAIVHRASGTIIGSCAYKGPPDTDKTVEIAYGVDPAYQGRGFATEAAQALVEYAMRSGRVRTVRAHTRPEGAASMRVLRKLGFTCVGEVIDPEDGLVLRWELRKQPRSAYADSPGRGRPDWPIGTIVEAGVRPNLANATARLNIAFDLI